MSPAIGYRSADVVVAGGGPGGTCAAIAAARQGAKVLLIEQLGFPGGMLTGGNMCMVLYLPWAGIGKEIFDRLKSQNAVAPHPDDPANQSIFHWGAGIRRVLSYDPELAKLILFEMLEEAGVELLLHTFVSGAVVEGNAVRGVTVANKSGTQVVLGKVTCDGTADGDVAAWAGAPFNMGMEVDKKLFAMTMMVRLSGVDWDKVTTYSQEDPRWDKAIAAATEASELPYYRPRTRDMVPYWGHPRPELARLWYKDGALLWGGTVEGVDGTNADDLTRAEVESRKQWTAELAFLKKRIPGFEQVRVEDSGATVGVRDTRHIVGDYTYSGQDVLEEREFPDTVAYAMRLFLGLPYRCLLPRNVERLLIASRCVSAAPGQTTSGPTLGAYNELKGMPTVMSYGQAPVWRRR